jgi:hypothetical protein
MENTMKKLLFFLSLLLVCGVQIYADVPKKLNIQGKLTSDSGQVLAEKAFSAALHLRPAGSSVSDNLIDTKTGTTDSNGLYNANFDVTNFNYSEGADFKVVITVESQVISTVWSSIASNPYTFYASTSSYAKILDPNQTEKLVDGNFNPAVIYKINVATAVAVSTASYTPGNAYVWGIGTNGVQQWTNPDIQVSTAAYAINAGTAAYATTIANGSVTTLKVADANITPAKLTQSDYGNVYKIKVDTATYALNATSAAYVSGSGLPDGSVTTIKIADTNVTPAKLQQGGGVLYDILVSTANNLNVNFKLADTNFTTNHVYTATTSYATTAGTAVTAATANALSGSFKLVDSNFTTNHVYTATTSYATTAGTAVTAATANALSGSFKLVDSNFTTNHVYTTTAAYATGAGMAVTAATADALSGSFKLVDSNFTTNHVYTTTAAYATGAGTASTVVNGAITADKIGPGAVTLAKIAADAVDATKIANNAVTESKIAANSIDTDHFKYTGGTYSTKYNIKVSSAEYADVAYYAETGGADLAEIYASTELLTPGDVVSIDTTKDNAIVKTKTAEDTLVAGVISTKPGLLMNKTEKGYELALVGKVPTKVCNEGGSIKRGDMLVSASMAGYAKKAGDNPKTGTVIGKALENFDSVTGTILVLVNLQ